MDYPSIMRVSTRKLAMVSVLASLGAATRMGIGTLAMAMPTAVYGLLIPVGLSETLAISSGFALGPVEGFLVGALIIVISDLYLAAGPWTPFIAAIIGLLGAIAGLSCGRISPNGKSLAVFAILTTLLSETLQNLWVAWFYSIPLLGVLIAGLPTLFSALVNNTVLLGLAGPGIIDIARKKAGEKSRVPAKETLLSAPRPRS